MADKVATAGRILTRKNYTEVHSDCLMECMPLEYCGSLAPMSTGFDRERCIRLISTSLQLFTSPRPFHCHCTDTAL